MNEQIQMITDELNSYDNVNAMTIDEMRLRLVELRVDRDNYCRGYLKALRELAEERELITKLHSELVDLREVAELTVRTMFSVSSAEDMRDKYQMSLEYAKELKAGTKKPKPYRMIQWLRILERDYE